MALLPEAAPIQGWNQHRFAASQQFAGHPLPQEILCEDSRLVPGHVRACFTSALALPAGAQASSVEQPDKYTWLEDIHGARSMAWVKAEDARTAAVMEKDPRFATLDAEALSVLESPDRLATPQFRGGQVYNVWRDAGHLRGIVRRTTLDSYLMAEPNWETVIDYDALSKADHQSWVGKGLSACSPRTICAWCSSQPAAKMP